ncbi:MAG: S-methyl-5-thioribose-1-phosphate isomerase [Desulfobacterales bacterium]
MNVDSKPMRPIWLDEKSGAVNIIDQRRLPHELIIMELTDVGQAVGAIREMAVRGAPLIGVTAAYGIYLAVRQGPTDPEAAVQAGRKLKEARPTAVNLAWAVDRMLAALERNFAANDPTAIARAEAAAIAEQEVANCRSIGEHGLTLIETLRESRPDRPVNVLTHCNAGWLACVEYGTATAPVYAAHERGIPVHVWVDETRPLNQGARLTAWELAQRGVPHTLIADNTGGHLMQHGLVDIVIVGSDRTTGTGDVANKIGTYLKALAARDNNVPFYVALPSSTFDWQLHDGIAEIPVEERDPDEIRYVQGRVDGQTRRVLVPPEDSPAINYAFDVTPARLVTGFITERGICRASEADIRRLFPEKQSHH